MILFGARDEVGRVDGFKFGLLLVLFVGVLFHWGRGLSALAPA